jgi:hypothetical protein
MVLESGGVCLLRSGRVSREETEDLVKIQIIGFFNFLILAPKFLLVGENKTDISERIRAAQLTSIFCPCSFSPVTHTHGPPLAHISLC